MLDFSCEFSFIFLFEVVIGLCKALPRVCHLLHDRLDKVDTNTRINNISFVPVVIGLCEALLRVCHLLHDRLHIVDTNTRTNNISFVPVVLEERAHRMATMVEMLLLLLLETVILVGLCVQLGRLWRRHRHPPVSGGRRLPPGSMGWPYVGETFHMYSQNPNAFFSAKQERYGDIFKMCILGCPCVMVASPEAAKFVLVSQAHIFKPTFPASKERMIGPNALFFHQGEYHTRLRKLVQNTLFPEAIRSSIPDIEKLALKALQTWEGRTINTCSEMEKYAFDVGVLTIFGNLADYYKRDLKRYYSEVEKGYNSLSINFPGSRYNRAIKARKKLSEIFSKIIAERREKNAVRNGMLGTFMASKDHLTDDQIADNMIGVLFAAQDTTASALTWILKYLADHPAILDAVTAEQDAILQKKVDGGQRFVSWADTKSMKLTSRVIQETLRIATILSFTFREAVEDVEYKGYLIPKGWKVLPLFRLIHHNPEFFPDPQKFDPSRFEVPPKPNTFLPFGSGAHACPGNELAKLEILILIHHLTTKYSWDVADSEPGIQYGPFPVPKGGLPAKIRSKRLDIRR